MECFRCNAPSRGNFCENCGFKIPTTNIERILLSYIRKGYTYNEILQFLKHEHFIKISLRTLNNRVKTYGIGKRNQNNYHGDVNQLKSVIGEEVQGCGQLLGYLSMWNHLRLNHNIYAPRDHVMTALQQVDPAGTEARRKHQLKCREYESNGPNDCWHIDGYDKLKPFGFPIHGAIDGHSHKILWLKVVQSNNDPKVIADLYLDNVSNLRVVPKTVRSNCGTENIIVARMQCYFRRNHNDEQCGERSYVYGSSHKTKGLKRCGLNFAVSKRHTL